MVSRYFCLYFLLILFQQVYGQQFDQEKYAKVKISLVNADLKKLRDAGIEIDHGILVKGRYLINDFSASELGLIQSLGYKTEILIEDVSAYYSQMNRPSELNNQKEALKGGCDVKLNEGFTYDTPIQYTGGSMGGFFTYEEMLAVFDTIARRYPELVSVRKPLSGFTTIRGNELYYIRISDEVNKDDATEPKVLYTALHHAREPLGLSQMIFYIWYLLENYKKDDAVTTILENTQLYFIPCINPDGYKQNQLTNPNGGGLWRKNLWQDSLNNVKGVDLNRNYGYFWGYDNSGSSNNPNSLTFRGKQAFSEIETRAVRAFCLEHDFKIALNYHTFGNYLIHPWGYNDLPTSEDHVFKAMGNVMTDENNFTLGTGSETVGYTVNGDSDDWMYGESAEKNAIYSLTPEVGPSFWPAPADIDYLNKSCVWMNLSAALLTLNYYTAAEKAATKYLTEDQKNIFIEVRRAGLKDGSANISLTSLTPGVSVNNPSRIINLEKGRATDLLFPLSIDGSENYPSGIDLKLEVNNDGIISTTIIHKEWISEPLTTIYYNNADELSAFDTEGWEITKKSYFSSPACVTDSEEGEYPAQNRAEITLKQPIDLSQVSHALLYYYAKWDIENNYDFVQVLASTDNNDFIPLCGKYTNPGTSDQSFNSPLYDGTSVDWVKEEVDLTAFSGYPEVWLRFVLQSDQYVQGDGFYFDELEVRGDAKVSSVNPTAGSGTELYPTIWTGQTKIFIPRSLIGVETILHIYDTFGRPVTQYTIHSPEMDIDGANLPNGLYMYTVSVSGLNKTSGKVIVLNP